ncbi:hypothetical protein OSTOST_16010 [Ostertagia ostertagi]
MVQQATPSEKIIGFNASNVDQNKRKADQQEQINRTVMSKILRVLFFPNPEKLPIKEVVEVFLKEVMRYNLEKDPSALCWYKVIGSKNDSIHFKAEMSYAFWQHFLEKGRKHLIEYNKSKRTFIKVVRGHTVKAGDAENLSLYMRLKIRKYLETECLPIPEMTVKNAYLTIRAYNGENIERQNTRKREAPSDGASTSKLARVDENLEEEEQIETVEAADN